MAAQPVGRVVAQKVQQARTTTARVKRGSKLFRQAMWAPLAKAGSVLWLEVTGVLFGMFACGAALGLWKERANFRATGAPLHHAWIAAGMFAVFLYFTVSSYVRAARRARQ